MISNKKMKMNDLFTLDKNQLHITETVLLSYLCEETFH